MTRVASMAKRRRLIEFLPEALRDAGTAELSAAVRLRSPRVISPLRGHGLPALVTGTPRSASSRVA
jgi:hypothetical protein